MSSTRLFRFKTIREFHEFRGIPKPEHPLISVIEISEKHHMKLDEPANLVFDFYCIALKKNFPYTVSYGQEEYDFDEGVLSFMAPGQVFGIQAAKKLKQPPSGWMLLVHPDFLWNTNLAKTISQYEYFSYAINEGLFLSEKEETIFNGILQNILQEYHANIDAFSQSIIITQLEAILAYAERFYHRQFITRKIPNHKILEQLELILTEYFNKNQLLETGLPTVQYVSDALNLTPNYLSRLLKIVTGQSTQQHIHDKLIEKAKEKLSATNLTVSEIAYELGFEHSQSFSKLFKSKTSVSPLAFRQSFN